MTQRYTVVAGLTSVAVFEASQSGNRLVARLPFAAYDSIEQAVAVANDLATKLEKTAADRAAQPTEIPDDDRQNGKA